MRFLVTKLASKMMDIVVLEWKHMVRDYYRYGV